MFEDVFGKGAALLLNYGVLGFLVVIQSLVIVVLWKALEKERAKSAVKDAENSKVILDLATSVRQMVPLVDKLDRGFEFIKMWVEASSKRRAG